MKGGLTIWLSSCASYASNGERASFSTWLSSSQARDCRSVSTSYARRDIAGARGNVHFVEDERR